MPNSTVQAAATGLPSSFIDPASLPDIYGLTVRGDCMAPAFPHGCNVKVSKLGPFKFDDIVVVWFRPEVVQPGHPQAMIKRVVMMPPPWVRSFPYKDNPQNDVGALMMLGTNEKPNEMLSVRCSLILAVHRCLGIIEPDEVDGLASRQSRPASRARRAAR